MSVKNICLSIKYNILKGITFHGVFFVGGERGWGFGLFKFISYSLSTLFTLLVKKLKKKNILHFYAPTFLLTGVLLVQTVEAPGLY